MPAPTLDRRPSRYLAFLSWIIQGETRLLIPVPILTAVVLERFRRKKFLMIKYKARYAIVAGVYLILVIIVFFSSLTQTCHAGSECTQLFSSIWGIDISLLLVGEAIIFVFFYFYKGRNTKSFENSPSTVT